MPVKHSSNKQFDIFFFLLFSLILLGMFFLFQDFWNVIFLSIVYSIIVNTIYKYLTRKSARMPAWAAAALTMVISMLIIVLPLILILRVVANQAAQFAVQFQLEDLNAVFETIKKSVLEFVDKDGSLITPEMIQSLHNALTNLSSQFVTTALNITRMGINFILNFFIFIIISFSLIPNLDKLNKYITETSPLGKDVTRLYLTKSKSVTVNMLKGTVLVAVLQASIAGLLLWAVGVPYISLWVFIMFILAFIPFFSTAFITIPIGVYLIILGDTVSGLILILGQLLVVGTVDNLIRPYIAAREVKMANALFILALIGGIKLWGIFGLFYGPLLLVLFYTSLEVYKERYSDAK